MKRVKEVRKIVRMALYIDEALWEKVRIAAIEERTSVSAITRKLFEKWLAEREKKRKGKGGR